MGFELSFKPTLLIACNGNAILTLSGNEIQGKQYIGTHANSE